jgi:hypothetical protein
LDHNCDPINIGWHKFFRAGTGWNQVISWLYYIKHKQNVLSYKIDIYVFIQYCDILLYSYVTYPYDTQPWLVFYPWQVLTKYNIVPVSSLWYWDNDIINLKMLLMTNIDVFCFSYWCFFSFQGQEAVRGYGSTTNGSKEPPPESLPLSPRTRIGSVRESSEFSDSSLSGR